MEIVKATHYKPDMNENEIAVFDASKSIAVRQMDNKQMASNLITTIAESLLITGQKNINDNDILQIAVHVSQMIKKSLPNMKVDEIKNAVKFGAFGEYAQPNDVVFVSAKNIYSWCKSYELEKHVTIKKQLEFELEKTMKERQDKREREGINEFANTLSKFIMDEYTTETNLSWLVYEKLKQTGLIEFPIKRKEQILIECEKKVVEIAKERFERPAQCDVRRDAIAMAKAIVLREWFHSHTPDEMRSIADECQNKFIELTDF